MGLDVGIISIRYLDRPDGRAYDFAWEMAAEASGSGYMSGEGNNWGYFERDDVRELLDGFSAREKLSAEERQSVWAWVESLPWDGDGIELHFNW